MCEQGQSQLVLSICINFVMIGIKSDKKMDYKCREAENTHCTDLTMHKTCKFVCRLSSWRDD